MNVGAEELLWGYCISIIVERCWVFTSSLLLRCTVECMRKSAANRILQVECVAIVVEWRVAKRLQLGLLSKASGTSDPLWSPSASSALSSSALSSSPAPSASSAPSAYQHHHHHRHRYHCSIFTLSNLCCGCDHLLKDHYRNTRSLTEDTASRPWNMIIRNSLL